MGSTKMKHTEEQISADGNATVSRLMFTPTIEAIGKVVMCRAENGQIPGSAIEDTFKLNINCKYFVCMCACALNLAQI